MNKSFIIAAFIGCVALAFILIYSHLMNRDISLKNACAGNQRFIDAAKEQAAEELNLHSGDTVSIEHLTRYMKGGMPKCPGGGSYTIMPIGSKPKCSAKGHNEIY